MLLLESLIFLFLFTLFHEIISTSSYNTAIGTFALVSVSLFVIFLLLSITFTCRSSPIVREFKSSLGNIDINRNEVVSRVRTISYGSFFVGEKYFIILVIFLLILVFTFLDANNVLNLAMIALLVAIFVMVIHLWLVKMVFSFILGDIVHSLNISFFDSNDEIEGNLFSLIIEPFNNINDPCFCICVVNDMGKEYCGFLEGIKYALTIRRREDNTVVSIPYEHVYEVRSCVDNKQNQQKSGVCPTISFT